MDRHEAETIIRALTGGQSPDLDDTIVFLENGWIFAPGGSGGGTGDGDKGWSPVFSIQSDGARRVLRLEAWVGGTGTAPGETGKYVGLTGLVTLIADGIDIRGPAGATGSGSGDMLASIYDPAAIAGNAFARANHTGSQAVSTVSGLQSTLDSKASTNQAVTAFGVGSLLDGEYLRRSGAGLVGDRPDGGEHRRWEKGGVGGINSHQIAAWDIGKIDELNITKVRVTIQWSRWRTEPGYQAEVASRLAAAPHLDFLFVLHAEAGASSLADFVDYVGEVHAMYPKAALQIWNEVDHPGGPGNGWNHFAGDPNLYRRHLISIRKEVPNAYLVSAGLAQTSEASLSTWIRLLHYSPVDAVAVHTYGLPLVGADPAPWNMKLRFARANTTKDVWNTEYGFFPSSFPEGWLEAENLTFEEAKELFVKEAYELGDFYDQVFFFDLIDQFDAGIVDQHTLAWTPLGNWFIARNTPNP